jgi:hypothetical protein
MTLCRARAFYYFIVKGFGWILSEGQKLGTNNSIIYADFFNKMHTFFESIILLNYYNCIYLFLGKFCKSDFVYYYTKK